MPHRRNALKGFMMWGFAFLVLSLGLTACSLKVQENKSQSSHSPIVGGFEPSKASPLAQSTAMLLNRSTSDLCTITILNNQFALTAAHCVEGANISDLLIYFDSEMKETSPIREVTDLRISNYYQPHLERSSNTGDIAVLRFANGVPKGYKAAKFLPDSYVLKNNVMVVAVGFGVTDATKNESAGKIRAVILPIMNTDFSESEITLDQSRQTGVCHGDSGGPVFVLVGGKYYLWGVTSRSINRNCSDAAIVTNALLYTSWIKDVILEMAQIDVPPSM